jgi:fatty acid desaturase
MTATMVPLRESLPQVFPTETLNTRGMPVGALRTRWRSVPQLRNAVAVTSTWLQTLGMLFAVQAIVVRTGWWPLWIVAFVLMGRGMAMFNILGHEGAHRLLFNSKLANDVVGQHLCSSPGFSSLAAYRRVHMAHHRDALGEQEPDLGLYNGYPITTASFWRKMRRDAFGNSGYKNLLGFLRGLKKPVSRGTTLQILALHVVLVVVLGVGIGWWAWPVLWFGPWMTIWRVINRLRAIAEHAGMQRSDDERMVTHHVRQSWPARFLMCPYNVGYHLAHHVDAGVSMWHLRAFTAELERSGYLTPTITYPSYRALWRALRSRN